jgi:hypothetical protein
MEHKFSRRQFGQAAIAGIATAASGLLAGKTFAQSTGTMIIGVNLGLKDTASPGRQVLLQTLNVDNGTITNLSSPDFRINPGEQISGFTILSSGDPILAVTTVSDKNKGNNPVVLVNLKTLTTIPVNGLNRQLKIGGIVEEKTLPGTPANLLALVLKKNGQSPITLYDINVQTGEITDKSRIKFPNSRVATLAQCSDGTLYSALLGDGGQVTPVKLDQQTKQVISQVELKIKNIPLNNGLQSLICSPANNQLYVLASDRYIQPNSVYLVDKNTGDLTLGIPFDAIQIASA